MLSILKNGACVINGEVFPADKVPGGPAAIDAAKKGTIAWDIFKAHNTHGDMAQLKLRFDAMASHDITYVGIVQTARASGLTQFPLPYVMTNCHNSLCAVGGTINEDDHVFGLSAAKKYGGEFVPAHLAVIHQYMRERYAGSGKMILASDSHTRYGPLGTLAIGEGGPELVKQLLCRTYDLAYPEIVGVCLTGSPRPGVGPQDVALALIGATFKDGLVKNKVLEFFGPGIESLGMDYRLGIDVMTTETACLSSVWATDEVVRDWLTLHGRAQDYRALAPADTAYYDALITIDLSRVEPMIALPFHPSNVYSIREFKENLRDILNLVDEDTKRMLELKTLPVSLSGKIKDGGLFADQGVIAGCSGGMYANMLRAASILDGHSIGDGAFGLSLYPSSQPVMLELMRTGALEKLVSTGATLRSAFCGPCFGAGDVPQNGGFSIRHTTRNFPNREGSKPGAGQIAYVALMDARSIAATALNKGRLTAATELPNPPADPVSDGYRYDASPYQNRVYFGAGKPQPDEPLVFGPNIADWPKMIPMPEDLLLSVACAIYDPVTTTDELIPSGETSSYRSNPYKLAEFTLSRKDPAYVGRAKETAALEAERRALMEGQAPTGQLAQALCGYDAQKTGLGSVITALKPGDGSAREQAASCQRVLGGVANIAKEYATKRYRSNVLNWGMIPFVYDGLESSGIKPGDRLYIPGVRAALSGADKEIAATLLRADGKTERITLELLNLTREERDIILSGCLINYYSEK